MTSTCSCSPLALAMLCLAAVAADAQTLPRDASTAPSGSYLNLQPRRRVPPALIQAPRTAQPEATSSRAGERTVVCGMTMLRGDNGVDQQMVRVRPQGNPGASRRFQLPMCAERQAGVAGVVGARPAP